MNVAVSPHALLCAHRLISWLVRTRTSPPETLHVEERLTELISTLFESPQRASSERIAPARIAHALEYLQAHFSARITLADVAKFAGCSPCFLSRQFAQHVGIPMHAYLSKLRVRAALAAVAGGWKDLTALALQLGFDSHSHMSAAFKREFGHSPSAARYDLAPN
ncbi:MAG: helix-turn-helix transcriptional regulator [Planctomycetota bacterium]